MVSSEWHMSSYTFYWSSTEVNVLSVIPQL